MSDTDKTTATNGSAPHFTERELQLLGWAIQSLKSGPPEIDYDKLAAFAGMSNPRSASNAWAKIKLKLMTPFADGTALPTPKKTPRAKKGVVSKKEGDEADGDATPKATPRKRASKKQEVDGDSSPKKKPARGKAAPKEEEVIKSEPDEAEDSADVDAIGSDEEIIAEV
ncbi:hypothetical protein GGP41_005413 [Bipolaris sorokiniana]|uniref:Myb-like domain-containing protein n=2 Tax=Cochliobolus sativus TaxID=45130 RepID=A0A8H5ZGB4_COCSA|nr:uncharacterized protein COCSADRAFT_157409 [Bipolaris sorokiniana ND90Pr]EMD66959.1 hypothetical protein COCSADRAFT_157409 [Bipolaris sorokiniana ND90Pr]KAF5849923.1 hypothetical protein GGP41_005413 [Bipolaris sorokiniana]